MPDEPSAEISKLRSELAALIPASHNSVVMFGAEALKAAALISGGSAAALMAFMGALISREQYGLASWLPWSLQMFVGGLVCACVATGISYLAQFMHGRALVEAKENLESPPFEYSARVRIYQKAGALFQLVAVALVITTYIVTILGYLAVYRAIDAVGFHPLH